jgi:hypothetical protein
MKILEHNKNAHAENIHNLLVPVAITVAQQHSAKEMGINSGMVSLSY